MEEKIVSEFIEILTKYDVRDLTALLIICSQFFIGDESRQEEYEGAKNLFSRIVTLYDYSSKNIHVNFFDDAECTNVSKTLLLYLTDKYKEDFDELSSLVRQKIISNKQFMFEISSPKTYPKTFVDSLSYKLKPFEDFLMRNYSLNIKQIQSICEGIIKEKLKPFYGPDLISYKASNIDGHFPKKFVEDLISNNEKIQKMSSINAFDKSVFCPIVKINDEFHIISVECFIDNFYKCLHRLCFKKSSKAEKEVFSSLKGKLFNDSCEELFKKLGFPNIHSNFNYDLGEIDLLINDADTLFVVECKSRNYTDKTSGLSESFKKANYHNLDYASNQVLRFVDNLLKNKKVKLSKNGEEDLFINASDYSYIIPVVINAENLAELNADFESRNTNSVYLSFDDLMIISDIIKNRKWLLVDFLVQLLECATFDAPSDDIIDMFAFYCGSKNLKVLFDQRYNVIVYKLGNDYFQKYFTYKSKKSPLRQFNNDVFAFHMKTSDNYKCAISKFHMRDFKSIEDFVL